MQWTGNFDAENTGATIAKIFSHFCHIPEVIQTSGTLFAYIHAS